MGSQEQEVTEFLISVEGEEPPSIKNGTQEATVSTAVLGEASPGGQARGQKTQGWTSRWQRMQVGVGDESNDAEHGTRQPKH